MRKGIIVALLAILMAGGVMASASVRAADSTLTISACTSDSNDTLVTPSRGCDGNTATVWYSAGGAGNPYPHWFRVNLTASSCVAAVSINWAGGGSDDEPSNFDIRYLGAGFINVPGMTSLSAPTTADPRIYLFSSAIATAAIQIYGNTRRGSSNYMGIREIDIGGTAGACPTSPPSIFTAAASSIGFTTGTVNGVLGSKGTASVVSTGFCYGTSSSLSGCTNHTVSSGASVGAFSYALTTLDAGTIYYFRAWANGDGYVTGSILNFTTLSPSLSVIISANSNGGNGTLSANFVSYISGGVSPFTYAWTFGDGASSTSASPSHNYTESGIYTARLVVTDSASPSDVATAIQIISVNAPSGDTTISIAGFPVAFIILSVLAIILFVLGLRINIGLVLFSGIVTLMAGFAGFTYTGDIFIASGIIVMGLFLILWAIGQMIDAKKEGTT